MDRLHDITEKVKVMITVLISMMIHTIMIIAMKIFEKHDH